MAREESYMGNSIKNKIKIDLYWIPPQLTHCVKTNIIINVNK